MDNNVDEGNTTDPYSTCQINHTLTSDEEMYDNVKVPLILSIVNNDVAGFKLRPYNSRTKSYQERVSILGPLCVKENENITYGFVLDSRPLFPITVFTYAVGHKRNSPLTIEPKKFTIPPESWNRTVAIAAAVSRDHVDNNEQYFSIEHRVQTNDTTYRKNVKNVTTNLRVTDHDDDVSGIIFSPSGDVLHITTAALQTQTVSVEKFNTRPSAKYVNISARFDQPKASKWCTLSPPSVSLNSQDWEKITAANFQVHCKASDMVAAKHIVLLFESVSDDTLYNSEKSYTIMITPQKPVVNPANSMFALQVSVPEAYQNYSLFETKPGSKSFNSMTVIKFNTSLARHVTRIRVRVGNILDDRRKVWSDWSEGSNIWLTASACDSEQQFLDARVTNDFNKWKCAMCPVGADCNGPKTQEDVQPLFGWWRIKGWKGGIPSTFSECMFPPACLGSRNVAFRGKYFSPTDNNDDLSLKSQNESCNELDGYANKCDRSEDGRCRLCGTCKRGFHRRSIGATSRCDKCPEEDQNQYLIAAGAAGLFLLFLLMLYNHMQRGGRRSRRSMVKMIVITYFQLSFMISMMDIPWPNLLTTYFGASAMVSTVGEHLVNFQCQFPNTNAAEFVYAKQIGYALLVPALSLLTYCFWFMYAKCSCANFESRGKRKRSPSTKDMAVTTIVYITYLLYPSICRQSFALLMCHSVDGKLYLVADLQEACYENRHQMWFLLCTVPQIILNVLGIPLLALHKVYKYRLLKPSRFPVSRFRYGILYTAYSPTRWYWGSIIASRKAIIALITMLNNDSLEVHFMVGYLAISIMANVWGEPYFGANGLSRQDSQMLQTFDSNALLVLLITAWSGLFFHMYTDPDCNVIGTISVCSVVQILVLVVNICFCIYAIILVRNVAPPKRSVQNTSKGNKDKQGGGNNGTNQKGPEIEGNSFNNPIYGIELNHTFKKSDLET
jgi:hypothetical protein